MGNKAQFYNTTWFMWVMMFILSPVGIFLMWKKRLYTPQARGIISAVFGVYFIVMMITANQDTNNKTMAKPVKEVPVISTPTVKPIEESKPAVAAKVIEKTPEVKPTEKPVVQEPKAEAPPSDLKEYIPWAIKKYAGDKSNIKNSDRIRSVEIDSKSIFIELMADDNVTKGTIKAEILEKSTAIFKQVFKDRTDVPKLFLSWSLPLQDVKGNESIDSVVTVSLNSDTAKTISWDKFTYSNLPKAATSYTEHEVLRK